MDFQTIDEVKAYLTDRGAKVVVTNDEIQGPAVDTRNMSFAYGFCFGAIHLESGLELTDFGGFIVDGQRERFYWAR